MPKDQPPYVNQCINVTSMMVNKDRVVNAFLDKAIERVKKIHNPDFNIELPTYSEYLIGHPDITFCVSQSELNAEIRRRAAEKAEEARAKEQEREQRLQRRAAETAEEARARERRNEQNRQRRAETAEEARARERRNEQRKEKRRVEKAEEARLREQRRVDKRALYANMRASIMALPPPEL